MSHRSTTLPATLAACALLWAGPAALAAQSCDSAADADPVVAGTVRDTGDRLPLVGARVRAEWRLDHSDAPERYEDAWTDTDGRFAFCAPPSGTSVRLRARAGSDPGPEQTVRAGTDGRATEVSLRAPLDEPDASSGLIGRIFEQDTGRPVPGAQVVLEGPDRRPETTNREGRFAFGALTSGTYVLRVEHLAYESFSDTVHLAPARPLQMRIPVAAEPIALEGIEVTVRSRMWVRRRADLYDRMERSSGHFITRSDIASRGEPPISHLLRGVPGVDMQQVGDGILAAWVPVIRNCGVPVIYVDNTRVAMNPGPGGGGIDDFVSSNVDVIEVHAGPAGVPIRYSGSRSGCGMIHIWTRDPG